MVELMQAGQPWQVAAAATGVQVSRSTAYRWLQEVRTRGEAALQDGRHGHPAKLRPPVLHWLESRCQQAPQAPSSELQRELQEQLGVLISTPHLTSRPPSHSLRNTTPHNPLHP